MKIVSDCFNFVTTILSYLIKFKIMSISQERGQNFGSGVIFSKNVLIKDLKISKNL